MNRLEFHRRVQRLEKYAAEHPRRLRLQVWGRVLLGYGLLLGGLLLPVFVGGWLCWFGFRWEFPAQVLIVFGIGLILLGLTEGYSLVRIELDEPEGQEIVRQEHPALDAILSEYEKTFSVSRLERILLTTDFNAAVVQRISWNMLGKTRNALILGAPLLARLTRLQVEAVLAHEFAHLSQRDGGVGNSAQRVRLSWQLLFESLSDSARNSALRWGRPLLQKAVQWYWPRLNAWMLVLSRMQEFQADAQAARERGATLLGQALVQVELGSRIAENWWETLWRSVSQCDAPPQGALRQLVDWVGIRGESEALPQALKRITVDLDTHPALSKRLAALGATPSIVESPDPSSGLDFLTQGGAEAIARLDHRWQQENTARWKVLRAGSSVAEEPEPGWEQARAVMQKEGDEKAIPLLQELVRAQPGHSIGALALGRIWARRMDPRAVPLLRTVADQAILASDREQALQTLLRYHADQGDLVQMEEVLAAMDGIPQAASARSHGLGPHGLKTTDLAVMRSELAKTEAVDCAYLARCSEPDGWHFVLCVKSNSRRWLPPNRALDRQLLRDIHQRLKVPGRLRVIPTHGGTSRLAKSICNPEFEIYRAGQ